MRMDKRKKEIMCIIYGTCSEKSQITSQTEG